MKSLTLNTFKSLIRNCDDGRPLKDDKNKKVIGKFKDEAGGYIITSVASLRAKMYSIRKYWINNPGNGIPLPIDKVAKQPIPWMIEIMKAKGLKKCVVDKKKHEEFLECVRTGKRGENVVAKTFQSNNQVVATKQVIKSGYHHSMTNDSFSMMEIILSRMDTIRFYISFSTNILSKNLQR